MKPKPSLQKTASQLADIMTKHLMALPEKERKKKIQAGDKILTTKKAKSSNPSNFDSSSKVALNSRTSRFQLVARGR